MFSSLKKIPEFTSGAWSMSEHGAQRTTYNGVPLQVTSLPSPPPEPQYHIGPLLTFLHYTLSFKKYI